MAPNAAKGVKSKKPDDGAFKQQRLKAWQPILTPRNVIVTYLLIGLVFAVVGAILLVSSNQVIEYEKEYTSVSECSLKGLTPGPEPTIKNCQVKLEVKEKMKQPVFLYYKLTNFYQNHRRYVKSRSDAQLRGETLTSYSDLADCTPRQTLEGTSNGQVLYPCGLIAYSMFNDTIAMKDPKGNDITLIKKGIAWASDKKEKFVYNEKNNASSASPPYWPADVAESDVEDEDFIVWMRVAGLPDFKKLYRKIETDLEPGTYTFDIASTFEVESFGGTKSVVLSTTTWIGGKNSFLAIMYLVVGFVCLALSLFFFLKNFKTPRTLGDKKYLVWNRVSG